MEQEICEFCEKIFTGEDGKDPKAQLHGHIIHCSKNPDSKRHPTNRRDGEEPDRKERVPFGMPQRNFKAPSDDGFHYRVFNDNWSKEPGRIERAKQAGYQVVEGQKHIAVGTNEDGSPIKGILMRIPQEWYDEDQKLKQVEVDKVDEQIKSGAFEKKPGDMRYVPAGGIRISESHQEPK